MCAIHVVPVCLYAGRRCKKTGKGDLCKCEDCLWNACCSCFCVQSLGHAHAYITMRVQHSNLICKRVSWHRDALELKNQRLEHVISRRIWHMLTFFCSSVVSGDASSSRVFFNFSVSARNASISVLVRVSSGIRLQSRHALFFNKGLKKGQF
jgi:hypothetical protein